MALSDAVISAEAERNPHLEPVDPEVLLDAAEYSAPPRPHTAMHSVIRRALDIVPKTKFTWADYMSMRDDSAQALEAAGVSSSVLDSAVNSARWILADRPSPEEVGAVEAKFSEGETPLAILYGNSPATSFPRRISEILVQGGVDHLMGHLTLGAAGFDPEDEERACILQLLASTKRAEQGSKAYGAYALAMIPGYRVHKGIPLRSFSSANQQELIAQLS